jgi:hypothetical protein
VLIVDPANCAGRGPIEITCGPSPLRSQARNPPTSARVSASHARPNTDR